MVAVNTNIKSIGNQVQFSFLKLLDLDIFLLRKKEIFHFYIFFLKEGK